VIQSRSRPLANTAMSIKELARAAPGYGAPLPLAPEMTVP
jgi:hypothetical protein